MTMRGVRGAIQVLDNTPEAIAQATRTLLLAIQEANPSLQPSDLASVFFTLTEDLNATYPALAAREMSGWEYVPLLCSQEIPVPSGMPRLLRVLLHWNTSLGQGDISHIYLGETAKLRPDLAFSAR